MDVLIETIGPSWVTEIDARGPDGPRLVWRNITQGSPLRAYLSQGHGTKGPDLYDVVVNPAQVLHVSALAEQ